MAWRIVKQPNCRYGRFSDTVDDFTHVNLDRDEVIILCTWLGGYRVAKYKLNGADDDKVWGKKEKDDGLNRWRASLVTIKIVHGQAAVDELLKEIDENDG